MIIDALSSNKFTYAAVLEIKALDKEAKSTEVLMVISSSLILLSLRKYLNIISGIPPVLPAKTDFPIKFEILKLSFSSQEPTINCPSFLVNPANETK